MKSSFWKKFIRIKIVVIAAIFVFGLLALQAPYFKSQIVKKITKELSNLTQSEVSISSYEGFVPLSFDLYYINFKKDDKVWLSIDRLSLNRSLLYFLFWKKKGMDLSLDKANLYSIPSFNPEKKLENFTWPKIPYYSLNIDLYGKHINVSDEVFNQKLPDDMRFKINLDVHRFGKVFSLKSSFTSDEISATSLKFNARGYQRQNMVHLDLALSDPNRSLNAYLKDPFLPSIDLKTSLSGAPDAYMAFINPQKKTDKNFRGVLYLNFLPTGDDTPLWDELIGDDKVTTTSEIYFDQLGLNIKHAHIRGSNIDFNGAGFLSRTYDFYNTYLEGRLSNLDFTKLWLDSPIEGKLGSLVKLSGNYKNPQMNISLLSLQLAYKHFIAYDFESTLFIEKFNDQYVGNFDLKASLNQSPLESSGKYTYCSADHYDLENLDIRYGTNTLNAHSLKRLGEVYQGRFDFDFKRIALISPLIKKEIHGDILGKAILDLDVTQSGIIQIAQANTSGSLLQDQNYSFSQYTASTKGVLDWKNLKDYRGEIQLSSGVTTTQNLNWESLKAFINMSPNQYQYKLQTTGEFAVSSSGQIEKSDDLWKGNIRQLSGHVADAHYNLIHRISVDYKKNSLLGFSPILLKVGSGQLYLENDSKKDIAKIDLRKFPIESLSYFIPGFDVRGIASLSGILNQISSNTYGSLSARFANLRVEDYQDHRPYHGTLELNLEKNSLQANAYLSKNKNDFAKLETTLPLSLSLFPWKFELKTDSKAKGELLYQGVINPFIQLLIPQNHLVEGKADIDLKMSGSLQEPSIEGYANLSKTYYENLFLGLVLKNVDVQMTASGRNLILDQFQACDDHGAFITADGKVKLSFKKHFPYELDFSAQKAQVLQFDFLTATLFGKGHFEGDLKKAYLEGKFDVTSAEINLPGSGGSGMPKLPVTYVYPRKETGCNPINRATEPLPIYFDVDLNFLDQTIIRGRGLDTSWQGKVAIRGSDLSPTFKGKLTSLEGTFDFAGRLFELQDGTINFDGHLSKGTSINLSAGHQIDQYQVYINLKGPLQAPYLSYRSEPSLTKKEVLSLVLFGQTAERLTPFQAVALTHTLATLGGVYMGPGVVDKLRKGIGLDQLSLGSMMHGDKDYTTIQVGKYITRSILITLHRPITQDPSPFVITAQFRGGFQMQTYFDQTAISQLLLQWRFSY